MKNINFLIFVLFLLGSTSCSTVKSSSSSKRVTDSSTASDKTVINYSRTLSADQTDQVVQLLREKLEGFPDQRLPIKFVNNTNNSHLDIYLKKKKIKFSFYSKLNLNEDNEEVMIMHQLKEKIDTI